MQDKSGILNREWDTDLKRSLASLRLRAVKEKMVGKSKALKTLRWAPQKGLALSSEEGALKRTLDLSV